MLANLKGFGKRIRLKLEQPLHEAYAPTISNKKLGT